MNIHARTFLDDMRARWRRPAVPPRAEAAAQPSFPVARPFLDDDAFRRAYAVGKATGSWWDADLEWRASVVCWAARQGASLDGDFIECGVHKGGYARTVIDYVDFPLLRAKSFFLVDTFSGVPARFLEGSASIFAGVYDDCHDEVVRTFAPFDNVRIVRGTIPEVLPEVAPERVAFLSIDLNAAAPSVAALEHFWPRLSRGAAVVLDDYNFELFADQRPALDNAAAELGTPILALPTGQGLMIKA